MKAKLSRSNTLTTNGEKTANPPSTVTNKSLTLLWGATGEQEWTPALTTGLHTNIFHNYLNLLIYFLQKISRIYIIDVIVFKHLFNVPLFIIKDNYRTRYVQASRISLHNPKERLLCYII